MVRVSNRTENRNIIRLTEPIIWTFKACFQINAKQTNKQTNPIVYVRDIHLILNFYYNQVAFLERIEKALIFLKLFDLFYTSKSLHVI